MADILWEGFDVYGIAGQIAHTNGVSYTAGNNMLGYWNTLTTGGSGNSIISLVPGRFSGQAIKLAANPNAVSISKTLPANYGTIIFGVAINDALAADCGIQFGDSGTIQVSINVNTSGQITVYRGNRTTLLATSVQSITAGTWHWLAGKIKFDGAAGTVDISLDGSPTSISLTGQNTAPSTHAQANTCGLYNAGNGSITFDDLVLFDTTGGTNNAILPDSRVETLFASSDSAVQFAFGAAVLGAAYQGNGTATNAPGANQLALRPFTTGPSGTLQDVRLLPAATSAGANFKAVLYNDNGSGTQPSGAPVATGTQVTGCTSGTTLILPFSVGQSLSASTTYWIGFITDTSVVLNESDSNASGFSVANTYGSGAPTSPTMTGGKPSWMIWGNLTATGVNWWEVDQNCPVGDLSYVFDSTVGHEDLFATAGLSSTPTTIYGVKVNALMKKSDAGARTVSLRIKSGATDSGGSLTGQNLTASYLYRESYFDVDPNTGVAWISGGVGSALPGYRIDS